MGNLEGPDVLHERRVQLAPDRPAANTKKNALNGPGPENTFFIQLNVLDQKYLTCIFLSTW
jgi:hypothetical protein